VGERAKLCTGGVRELWWQVAERLIDYAPEF
jgi:hypothetical protein